MNRYLCLSGGTKSVVVTSGTFEQRLRGRARSRKQIRLVEEKQCRSDCPCLADFALPKHVHQPILPNHFTNSAGKEYSCLLCEDGTTAVLATSGKRQHLTLVLYRALVVVYVIISKNPRTIYQLMYLPAYTIHYQIYISQTSKNKVSGVERHSLCRRIVQIIRTHRKLIIIYLDGQQTAKYCININLIIR